MQEKRIERTITPDWLEIREIRQLVWDELAYLAPEIQGAAAMASAELLENAIKHGASIPSPLITYALVHSAREVRVETRNAVASEDVARALSQKIGRIAKCGDRDGIHVRRLEQMLADCNAKGKLGLLRIAFEAGFELRYSHTREFVTITAARKPS